MIKNDFILYVENQIGREIKFYGILENIYEKVSNLRLNIYEEEIEKKIYVKNKKYPERGITYNGENYYVNPDLIEEIYLWYKFKNEYHFGKDFYLWDINQIKFKTSTILNQFELKKVLEKQLKKYRKRLIENDVAELYFYEDDTLNIESDSFQSFIRSAVFSDEDLVNDYLAGRNKTSEEAYESFSDYSNPLLESWNSFIRTKKTIDFIIEELKKIESKTEINQEYKIKKANSRLTLPLTLPQKILLIDRIKLMDIDDWYNLHNTKKAKLMSLITGHSYQTIRKIIPKTNQKVKEDIEFIDSLIKKELG